MRSASVRGIAESVQPLAILLAAITLVSLGVASFSGRLESAVTLALILVVAVVALYVFVGLSGVMSFGSIGFMAIGAYTAGLAMIPTKTKAILLPELPGWMVEIHLAMVPALAAGAAVAMVIAFVTAIPLMRLSGIAAGIATLSLLVIINEVLRNWKAIGGAGGQLTGVPLSTGLSAALIAALGACVVGFLFARSRPGMRLRATREDAVAARGIGISVSRQRMAGFVVHAGLLGVAGGLYAGFLGSFGPEAFYVDLTFLTLAMLVVGGTHSLAGAVVGVAAITVLTELFQSLEEGGVGPLHLTVRPGLRDMVIAALAALVIFWRPEGITSGRELLLFKKRPRRSGGKPETTAVAGGSSAVDPDQKTGNSDVETTRKDSASA